MCNVCAQFHNIYSFSLNTKGSFSHCPHNWSDCMEMVFQTNTALDVLTDFIAEVKRESAYKVHPVIIQFCSESGD